MVVSESVNFRDVFSREKEGVLINSIVIPSVQRDYAQGRRTPEVNRIRTNFLHVLYSALVEGKKTTLDFVYGNVEDGCLIPLDGQQRLTTLFLLHFYIALHENVPVEEWQFLSNFSYETRISSREFCQHLLQYKPDFTQSTISEQLVDEAWFLLEWENDPSVTAMLVMLDAIHDKFKNTSNLWTILTGDAITFYFLPLSQMGVTDELYIKMNSRGKPLTQYEHFKAELELQMKKVDEIAARRIITKMDRDWTDLLWPFRDSQSGNASLDIITDDEFLRYFRFLCDIIILKTDNLEVFDDFDRIDKLFSIHCPNALDNMLFFEKLFDLWCGFDTNEFFREFISRKGYEPGKIWMEFPSKEWSENLFKECLKRYGIMQGNIPSFSLGNTIILYAFVLFLSHKDSLAEIDFRRRLRILNNLVKNSADTVRWDYMPYLIVQVEEFVLNGTFPVVSDTRARFQSKQLEEEMAKLEWTNEHPEMAETLFKLEDHPYLNGYVHAVGLDHVDWCERFYSLFPCDILFADNPDREIKKEIKRKAQDRLNAIIRAMLSLGDCFEKDAWRFQIGSASTNLANGVWRELFSPVRLEDNFCIVLQDLLSRFEDFSEMDKTLNPISWNYLQRTREMTVRFYLVKYSYMRTNRDWHIEGIFDYDNYGKFFWRNHDKWHNPQERLKDYNVILMTTRKHFGFNYDIFLKTLFEIAGGEKVGLGLDNWSYWEYNNYGENRLHLRKQELYLTLIDNVYRIHRESDKELIEQVEIMQNEDGIDVQDRVQIGLRLLNKYMNLYDKDSIREYIGRCEWTFAKTMPQYPHEYIVRGKCPLSEEEFLNFVWAQRTLGEYQVWGPYYQPYLIIDDYKYWTMGCEIEVTTIMNREKLK